MAYDPAVTSIVTFQSDPTKLVGTVSVVGTMNINPISSIAVNLQSSNASVITTMANQSVSGTVQAQLLSTNASVITSASVVAFQSTPLNLKAAFYGYDGSNPQIIFTDAAGTLKVGSVITTVQSSVAAAITNISASIIANQGTNPWVIQSIVGTYAEDAVHTTADKGIFALGVRNETMSSITSADGDYSPLVVGPVGEVIVANSPVTKWVSGATSVMYGTSVQVLAAPGTSIFTYITGLHVINESANLSRVTITQGRGGTPASMMTWAIAPAAGGSNMNFPNPLKTVDNVGVSASISGVSSVFVTITGFTSKT